MQQRNIVFYSESGQDWHHFQPIIQNLIDMSYNVCYVSSDENDPGLSLVSPAFSPILINNTVVLIIFFQFLKADCMVLTMIDLHIFHLKRSIHPVHYIYLFHAMGSTHMVDFENSYDHYDTILCTGPHQIREIHAREKLIGLPEKKCIPHGYARVERLMNDPRKAAYTLHTPCTILVAPTWGPQSILPICGKQLVACLIQSGYNVILRPHYQTNKLMPEVVDEIVTMYKGDTHFSYVDHMGETDSLFTSDLLICDWSSTSIEYALGLEKPVLYIDVPRRVRNNNYGKLDIEPLEVTIRSEVGDIVSPEHLNEIPEKINRLLSAHTTFKNKIVSLREKVLFNIGNSVAAGTQAIAAIADDCSKKRNQR
jgi:YidC/Oxa1 family membrane protein insertase